jgi:serine/threonine-protein kinase
MSNLTQCPIGSLQAYLDDTLDASLQSELVAHLDQCKSCRERIEQRAGSDDDWLTARNALAHCDLDANCNIVDDQTLVESFGKTQSTDPLSLLKLLAPSDDPRAAGRIGPFEITGIIGSGGMGMVLKARDPALDRFVAVKILAPHLARSQSARKRFAREARAAAAVIHDNVIAIYQVAEWNELPYLVMPYMPDPSLQQRIDDQGPIDLESTLSIGMQVARGLAAAHTQGLVHRDVKPANVLLAKGTERAVITDFGLARAADDATLTRIGLLAGTPHYMSPEQARGEAVDQKSDLFSLGSLLFAMITGKPPIASELGSETIQQIARGQVPSLRSHSVNAPAWFSKLVDSLHRPHPADRPESAAQVAQLLEQCLANQRQPELQPLPECLLPNQNLPRSRFVRALVLAMCALAVLAYPAMLALKRTEKSAVTKPEAQVLEPNMHEVAVVPETATQLTDAAPSKFYWLGDQSALDELDIQSTVLETRIDQTWSISPQSARQDASDFDAGGLYLSHENPEAK